MDKAISPKRKKSSFTFERSHGPQSSVITGVLNTEREKDEAQTESISKEHKKIVTHYLSH